jgi:transcriptional regulator with XRE-family HTH domain
VTATQSKTGSASVARRGELSAFLRARRERVLPADVGLAPGLRRRTPGLRREEVAQLAGVGVTWYTWLEQGRPINASVQVLDAISRVLKLGPAERWHLYRLADVPGVPKPAQSTALPAELPRVLDALDPLAAAVYNGRYDLLACNSTYGLIFPGLVKATGRQRNALWQCFTVRPDQDPLWEGQLLPHMVATARANFARHVGEPDWDDFVRELSDVSPRFASLWATHQVAEPQPTVKRFNCPPVGVLNMTTLGYAVEGAPECRMIVYLPAGDTDAVAIQQLRQVGGVHYERVSP